MTLNDKVAHLWRRLEAFFEAPRGRRGFWAATAVIFLIMGFFAVKRAEVPKRWHAPVLNYESPVDIDYGDDPQADYSSSEFRGFRRISWAVVVKGLDPYRDLDHIRAYPPFFGIAFFPFAAPWRLMGVGGALMYATGFALALLAAWAWSGVGAADGKPRFGRFAMLFFLTLPLVLNILARSSSQMIVVGPLALGCAWLARGRRPVAAGALLGFAAAFKVLPGLFGVYLLATRQWRALGAMAGAGVLCWIVVPALVFGPGRAVELHRSWIELVVAPYGQGEVTAIVGNPFRESNQSFTAAANRYLRDITVMAGSKYTESGRTEQQVNFVSLSEETLRAGLRVAKVGILGGLIFLWAFTRRAGGAGRAVLAVSPALGLLLLSEISTTTHHALLALPLAALLTAALDRDLPAARRWLWLLPGWGAILLATATVKYRSPLFLATALLAAATLHIALADRRGLAESHGRARPADM